MDSFFGDYSSLYGMSGYGMNTADSYYSGYGNCANGRCNLSGRSNMRCANGQCSVPRASCPNGNCSLSAYSFYNL